MQSIITPTTLIRALKTTIHLNDVGKSKLLLPENNFNNSQFQIIYENINLLDENNSILSQAVYTILTLVNEIEDLKEIKNKENEQNFINFNSNLDYDLVNRYKNEEENNLMNSSLKANLNLSKTNMESSLKNINLHFDYENEYHNIYKNDSNSFNEEKLYVNYSKKDDDDLNKYSYKENRNKLEESKNKNQENFLKEKEQEKEKIIYEKKSFRQLIQKNKTEFCNIEEPTNSYINKQNENENYVDTNNDIPIDIIKISNEIMQEIHETENFSNFFSEKYSKNSYRNFLSDLIEYKFNIETLLEILNDIKLINNNTDIDNLIITKSNKEKLEVYKKTKSEKNNSFDSKGKIKENNGTYLNQNFEEILRNENSSYCSNGKINKKPFNRFGKTNGEFFEKNILKKNISSPL